MKKGIHPKWNENVKVIANGQVVMEVGSTSEELNVEIWSGNHPFYTGKETLVDTDNLVEKFNAKLKAVTDINKKTRNKKIKRVNKKRTNVMGDGNQVTLKDMLKNFS